MEHGYSQDMLAEIEEARLAELLSNADLQEARFAELLSSASSRGSRLNEQPPTAARRPSAGSSQLSPEARRRQVLARVAGVTTAEEEHGEGQEGAARAAADAGAIEATVLLPSSVAGNTPRKEQADGQGSQWSASRWLQTLDLYEDVTSVLGSFQACDLCSLSRDALDARLTTAGLSGHAVRIWMGIEALRGQQHVEQSGRSSSSSSRPSVADGTAASASSAGAQQPQTDSHSGEPGSRDDGSPAGRQLASPAHQHAHRHRQSSSTPTTQGPAPTRVW
jgi:hypothetical protein